MASEESSSKPKQTAFGLQIGGTINFKWADLKKWNTFEEFKTNVIKLFSVLGMNSRPSFFSFSLLGCLISTSLIYVRFALILGTMLLTSLDRKAQSAAANAAIYSGQGWGAPSVGVPMQLQMQAPPPPEYSGGAADDWSQEKEQRFQTLMAERQQKTGQHHQAGGGCIEGGLGSSPSWNTGWYPSGGGGGAPPNQGGGWSQGGSSGGGGGYKMPGN